MKEKNSFVVYPYPKDEHTEEENTKEIVSKSISSPPVRAYNIMVESELQYYFDIYLIGCRPG